MAYLYDKTIAKFIRQITNKECNFVDRKIKKILM